MASYDLTSGKTGRTYKVDFANDPTPEDVDFAIDYFDNQPVAEEQPGYLSQLGTALSTGTQTALASGRTAFNVLTGDTEDTATALADLAAAQREAQAAQTPEDVAFLTDLQQQARELEAAEGILPTLREAVDLPLAALRQPGAALKTAVQSLPNVLVSTPVTIGAGLAGAAAGGLVGLPTTGPGALVTGALGAAAGGALANTALEVGPAVFDILNERTDGAAANWTREQILEALKADPTIVEEGLKRGATRGAVIGATEAIGLGAGSRLAGASGRAIQQATRRALVEQGVDLADDVAVRAGLQLPAVQAAREAAQAGFTRAGEVARVAAGAGIETAASGAGELLAQVASGQDVSTVDAFLEMLGEGVAAVPSVLAGAAADANAARLQRAAENTSVAAEALGDLFPDLDELEAQVGREAADAVAQAVVDAGAPAVPALGAAGRQPSQIPPPPLPIFTDATSADDIQREIDQRIALAQTTDFGLSGDAQLQADLDLLQNELAARTNAPTQAAPAAATVALPQPPAVQPSGGTNAGALMSAAQGGLERAFRNRMRDRIAKGETVIFTRPDSIEAARNNPFYITQDLPDGTVQVTGVRPEPDEGISTTEPLPAGEAQAPTPEASAAQTQATQDEIQIAEAGSLPPVESQPLVQASAVEAPEGAALGGREGQEGQVDLPQELVEWDRDNRNTRGDEWFTGGHMVNREFEAAAAEGADRLQAHGMAKEATLSGGLRNLLNLLRNGVDPRRGGGQLYTAQLAKRKGQVGVQGATASGTAYRDGPFVLVQNREASQAGLGIRNVNEIAAVLVNEANVGQLDAIRSAIQSVNPNIIVAPYSEVSAVTRQILNQPVQPMEVAPAVSELAAPQAGVVSPEGGIRTAQAEFLQERGIADTETLTARQRKALEKQYQEWLTQRGGAFRITLPVQQGGGNLFVADWQQAYPLLPTDNKIDLLRAVVNNRGRKATEQDVAEVARLAQDLIAQRPADELLPNESNLLSDIARAQESIARSQPLPPTGGVPTESLPAGQPTSGDVGTALRAVATNTATPEQVASLEAQGLARTVQGQPVITDAGLAQMPEAERPSLTEAERVAEIEGGNVGRDEQADLELERRLTGGREPASWVIRDINTKDVVMETFDRRVVQRLNRNRYEAIPIGVYLSELNTPPANVQPSIRPLQGDQQRNETLARRKRPRPSSPTVLRARDGQPLPNIRVTADNAAKARDKESRQVPGASETWIGTTEQFLAEFADTDAGRAVEDNASIEAFYDSATDRAVVLTDRVQVLEGDARRAVRNGTSAAEEAVRRLIRHESFVHRGWRALPSDLRTQFLALADSVPSAEDLDAIAKTYRRYANWRDDPSLKALVFEEWLAQRIERIEKLPAAADGPLAQVKEWLGRVWQWLTGDDSLEATPTELANVIRTMVRALETGEKEVAPDAGIRPSFIGEKAQMSQFMRDSLEAARSMAAAGKPSEEIRAVTGWFPGLYDGKMRWELPDNEASIKDPDATRLADLIDHPTLFSAYPTLNNVEIFTGPQNSYSPADDSITLKDKSLSVILHEVQHAIQKREGFAKGGDSRMAFADPRMGLGSKKGLAEANRILQRIVKEMATPMSLADFAKSAWQSEVITDEIKASYEDYIKTAEKAAKDPNIQRIAQESASKEWYRRLAGEIEARDVQARRTMTPEQRRATAPYSSENIAPEDAIVIFDGREQGVMASLTDTDAAYMDAVARGDMETAQRLVDEAAKKAGYNVGPVWHGTNSEPFTEFDPERIGEATGSSDYGNGFYFARERENAGWGRNIRKFFLKLSQPLETSLSTDEFFDEFGDTLEARELLESQGYDGVIHSSGRDIVAFDPSQIKSADPVTYDDAGNVIPLSQRFQPESTDIRFSLTQDPDADTLRRIVSEASEGPEATSQAQPFAPGVTPDMPLQRLADGRMAEANLKYGTRSTQLQKAKAKEMLDAMGPIGEWGPKLLSPEWRASNGLDLSSALGQYVLIEGLKRAQGRMNDATTEGIAAKRSAAIIAGLQSGTGTNQGQGFNARMNIQRDPEYAPMFVVQGAMELTNKTAATVVDPQTNVPAATDAVRQGDEQARQQATDDLAEELRLRDLIYDMGIAAQDEAVAADIRAINDDVFRIGTIERLLAEMDAGAVAPSLVGLSRAAAEQEFRGLTREQLIAERDRLREQVRQRVEAVKQAMDAKPKAKGRKGSDPASQAKALIDKLEASPQVPKKPKPNPVRDLYQKHLKEPMAAEDFIGALTAMGVDIADAQKLYDLAAIKIVALETAKANRPSQKEKLSEAERFAERVINDAAEQFADPALPVEEKQRKTLPIRDLFNFHVQNGMTLETFIPAAAQAGLDEATARRLHGAGLLVREARQSVKTARAEARLDEMAVSEAGRLIYETSKLHRQSGYVNTPSQAADTIRSVFMEQVKTPVTFEQFAERLKALRVDEDLAARLFNVANRETAARQAMAEERQRQANIRREIKLDEMAAKEAGRLIYETSKLHRQSGYINATSPEADTIRKAFMDQVKKPVPFEQFAERLKALRVEEDLATRLFNVADREHAARKAVALERERQAEFKRLSDRADRLLDPEKNALASALNAIRSKTEGAPTWQQLFNQPFETQRQWRQRFYEALRADPALANLTPQETRDLAAALDKVWNDKRERNLQSILKRANLPGTKEKTKQKIAESVPLLLRYLNTGVFNDDSFRAAVAKKFGAKVLGADDLARISTLAQEAQADGITQPERNQKLFEMVKIIQQGAGVELGEVISNYWVTAVLSGFRTQFDMALSSLNGLRVMAQTAADVAIRKRDFKMIGEAAKNYFKTMANAILESANYFVTGDPTLLDGYQYTMNQFLQEGIAASNPFDYFEQVIKDPRVAGWRKITPYFFAGIQRAMRIWDHVNSTAVKEGMLPLAMALNPEKYKDARMPSAEDVAQARQKALAIVGGDKTYREKRAITAYTRQILNDVLESQYPGLLDEAREVGFISAYQNDPTGFGGIIYHTLLGVTKKFVNAAGKFRDEGVAARENSEWSEARKITDRFMRAALYILASNARNFTGTRFVRFVGNRVNELISFTPVVGLARLAEKDMTESKKSMIYTNQVVGGIISLWVIASMMRAMEDEEDEEKRGWNVEGSWANLTPTQKNQRRAEGRIPYSLKIGDTNFNYNAWPMASLFATVGNLYDMKRYRPDKWNEKDVLDKTLSSLWAGGTSIMDLSSISGLMDLLGRSAYSTDPVEGAKQWAAKFSANYVGGFIPRALKDLDMIFDPEARKPDNLFGYFAKEIPFYRRTEAAGEKLYDIFGEPVQMRREPWSRSFSQDKLEPEYNLLGDLNERGIFLSPANPDNRTVGSGANRRELTKAEAEAYMMETGKLYKDYVLQQGERLKELDFETAKEKVSRDTERLRNAALRRAISITAQ